MKILTAQQIRDWDEYTMKNEPVASIDLMERAAGKCFNWLEDQGYLVLPFIIFCGKGNNGGDGLAIARMLAERSCSVKVCILDPIAIGSGFMGTVDFQTNLARLQDYPEVKIHFIKEEKDLPELPAYTIVIDALLGSGLTRPLDSITKRLVEHINKSGCEIISIDIPSGLSVDQSSKGNTIITANHTLSFQCYKTALLLAENAAAIGETHILDIGLHPGFLPSIDTRDELITEKIISTIYKPRNRFSHKGNFGHALLIAGSYGKNGAAALAAKACLRSGVGLLSCHVPKSGTQILQSVVPEAMVQTDTHSSFVTRITDDILKYNAVGIGPGIGTATLTKKLLHTILKKTKKPMLLDADALNLLAMEKNTVSLPPGSVLTPHPKEFERLFGKSKNDYERNTKGLLKAKSLKCIIVLKGHHTFIATPNGKGFFNSNGNAGMATAGSGDVLAGIITGLLVQGYSSEHAAVMGVFLHGLAGDIAAAKFSKEAMIASDIIECMGEAFTRIST